MNARRRPLPLRDGMDPVRTRLTGDGADGTVLGELTARFAHHTAALAAQCAAGTVVTADGSAVTPATPTRPGLDVWMYRPVVPETPIPFDVPVLHHDDRLIVVDKPPFLATIPRGRHVVETVLVRLRRRLAAAGRDDLAAAVSPVHRLDRLTSGVLLFTCDPAVRGAYQRLFADGRVHKEYEALAPPLADTPAQRRSHLLKRHGDLQTREVPAGTAGAAEAHTRIRAVTAVAPGVARYLLEPTTGRTHQLRVHLAALGAPILHDPLYPAVLPDGPEDHTRPLALLARSVRFIDPLDGTIREFRSHRTLAAPAPTP